MPEPKDGSFHWLAGPGAKAYGECRCDVGWTGSNCEYNQCDSGLLGGSLGSLLVQSDFKLTQYTNTFNNTNTQLTNAKLYLNSLLKVQVDLNGDGNITRTEMLSALKYRSIVNVPIALKLWCRTPFSNSYCYADVDPNTIAVSDMYKDMEKNFLYSTYHTFDGSGNPLVSSMTSTYPSPSWTAAQCQLTNMQYTTTPQVVTDWTFSSITSIFRVCGYINGGLSTAFSSTDALSGKNPTFKDTNAPVSIVANFKRVYCVSLDYATGCSDNSFLNGKTCATGTVVKATSFECSVGLFYVRIFDDFF